ncbi:hypothetical protein CCMA1212_003525 [Trichoderma ghanense]|uniref:Uncharacterized protein n=1 Tax=Trichoderma ghanense TaxID=65468 RepID=A0ABY2H8I5_9HYPO
MSLIQLRFTIPALVATRPCSSDDTTHRHLRTWIYDINRRFKGGVLSYGPPILPFFEAPTPCSSAGDQSIRQPPVSYSTLHSSSAGEFFRKLSWRAPVGRLAKATRPIPRGKCCIRADFVGHQRRLRPAQIQTFWTKAEFNLGQTKTVTSFGYSGDDETTDNPDAAGPRIDGSESASSVDYGLSESETVSGND